MTFVAFLLLAGGFGILVHRAFVFGYNAGWEERHRDMTISATRLPKPVEPEHDQAWHSFLPPERVES